MMINLPYEQVSMSQVTGCQNVPVQTGQNNFPSYQQPQTASQQMQTGQPSVVCSGNPQGQNQHTFNIFQPDVCAPAHHSVPCKSQLPINQNPRNFSPNAQPYLHNGTTTLPQCVLDQIRGCVSCAAPIFVVPGGYQVHQQPAASIPSNYGSPAPSFPTQRNTLANSTPQPIYCPPSFYPYPVPMPMYGIDSLPGQTRTKEKQSCDCRRRSSEPADIGIYTGSSCCQNADRNEHRCTHTDNDTVCSKQNCPLSINLQALAAQLLSMQGIIPCAAIRLLLRKVPGSNVTTSIEDTMERAQNCISSLTKDQLLAESRYAHQVNALINLHMSANPPQSVIPILTHVQLKVNVLKAHVESLINKKMTENEGLEIEATNSIEPAILALKTDNELRELLTLLSQKECDERVNLNFSPYRSQRVIAEMRLKNVQNKIRQIEAEFDRRRCTMVPGQSMSYRTIQQFPDPTANFSCLCDSTFNEPSKPPVSPDPFSVKYNNPKRLILRPHVGSQNTTYYKGYVKATGSVKCDRSTASENSKDVVPQQERPEEPKKSDACCQDDRNKDRNESEGDKSRNVDDRRRTQCRKIKKDRQDNRRPSQSSTESSTSFDELSTSDESVTRSKKKLRLRVDKAEDAAVKFDAEKNSGSYVCSTVRQSGNSSVRRTQAIDDRSVRDLAFHVKADSNAMTGSFVELKPKSMAKEVYQADDVFENTGASRFAAVETAEAESEWDDAGVFEGSESTGKEEVAVEIPMSEKSLEQKKGHQGVDVSAEAKMTTRRKVALLKLFSKTEEPMEDSAGMGSDVLAVRGSVGGEEKTGKFVKIEPTDDQDESEEIAPRADFSGQGLRVVETQRSSRRHFGLRK